MNYILKHKTLGRIWVRMGQRNGCVLIRLKFWATGILEERHEQSLEFCQSSAPRDEESKQGKD